MACFIPVRRLEWSKLSRPAEEGSSLQSLQGSVTKAKYSLLLISRNGLVHYALSFFAGIAKELDPVPTSTAWPLRDGNEAMT